MARKKAFKETDPQTVRVRVQSQYGGDAYLSGSELEGTPDEVIQKMEAMKADYPGRVLKLEYEQHRYDDYYAFYLYEERLETDEERDSRVALAKEQRAIREDRERAEYERLAKRFAPK